VSNQKHHKSMDTMDRVCKIVRQSSHGIKAIEIAEKVGIHKTTVHRALFSLEQLGMVESRSGIWFPKTGEQTIKPLEKEIVIELPIPRSEWQRTVLLEQAAELFGQTDHNNIFKTSLDKLKETRTIRITGKNVDDLDLQKIVDMVQQANQSFSSKVKQLLKKFRISKRQVS
jgi:predicted ArsR family transcriptional regulator